MAIAGDLGTLLLLTPQRRDSKPSVVCAMQGHSSKEQNKDSERAIQRS